MPADGTTADGARRRLQIRVLDPRIGRDYPLPQYATSGSAGVDLRACVDAPLELKPGDSYQIPVSAVHDAKAGPNGVKVLAVYVIEKGKPLASPAP